ncbi:1-phosphofructokinase family hexose kinase [Paenibacillus sp. CF384]|uniref:1-phosphofructokinase family hexose kinase n=1 Tax=Paenibacillus sp. CF384 TaxID=1884382 RepID=UPI00089923B1|nr:1-phosphofructokinase family hexose kinase [Paenibacillus sp. CF384]SDW17018.1 tagatose 6-phosphate kinase [Paenibacillus sp. CF384]
MTGAWTGSSSIVCASLNTAIDKQLVLPAFHLGEVNRVSQVDATAGGKGLNVARVAKSIGAPVLATGFAGGSNGSWIMNKLQEIGLEQQMVSIEQESRICLNIIDEGGRRSTELLEPGPNISVEEKDRFIALWRSLCVPGRWLTLSGSLPRGLGDRFYADLITEAKLAGAHVVLDTSGTPLELGARSGPHTVKPNEDEFRQWSGSDPRDYKAVRRMAARLGEYGVQTLIVSLGADGCLAATPDGRLWLGLPPIIEPINTVGCGDSFVAGWTVACARGLDIAAALQFAVAVGTANAMTPGTGQVNLANVEELLPRVKVTSH